MTLAKSRLWFNRLLWSVTIENQTTFYPRGEVIQYYPSSSLL